VAAKNAGYSSIRRGDQASRSLSRLLSIGLASALGHTLTQTSAYEAKELLRRFRSGNAPRSDTVVRTRESDCIYTPKLLIGIPRVAALLFVIREMTKPDPSILVVSSPTLRYFVCWITESRGIHSAKQRSLPNLLLNLYEVGAVRSLAFLCWFFEQTHARAAQLVKYLVPAVMEYVAAGLDSSEWEYALIHRRL
jgi:hypothetical protein